MNYNIEHLTTLYKNEIELKDYEIESLSKELFEIKQKIKKEKERKQLLLLETKKIKEIYSLYKNKLIEKEQEKEEKNKNKENDIKKTNINMVKNELKNRLLLKGCNFYNNINKALNNDDKDIININKYSNDNINNNINLLYDLENKLQLIENNVFKDK